VISILYAWRTRHPLTSADFPLLYSSAARPPALMYQRPPGPGRGNLNSPPFQVLLLPLTALSMPAASAVFRAVNIVCLIVCLWWIGRTQGWELADIAVLLLWAPMASVISLNQLTWMLWPLLVWTWWCWRQDRWEAGAAGLGLALALKSFLGVFLLWLLITRRWRAAVVTLVFAALPFGVSLLVYGIDVHREWLSALGNVTWWWAVMNASFQGLVSRTLVDQTRTGSFDSWAALVGPLSTAGALVIVALTLWRTRRQTVDESWPTLMIGAVLASPLGWLYYIWWILPGTKPSRLLFQSPLLWIPMYISVAELHSRWMMFTIGSLYFWGLLLLWLTRLRSADDVERLVVCADNRQEPGMAAV
jgi:hypothetical protein